MNRKHFKLGPTITLLLLIFIFVGPIVAAWGLYYSGYGKDGKDVQTTNIGSLIQPPIAIKTGQFLTRGNRSLNVSELRGYWSMLFVTSGACNQVCEYNLYKMRQVRLALGKDRMRMRRYIVTDTKTTAFPKLDELLKKEYLGTVHLRINEKSFAELKKSLRKGGASLEYVMFVIDPHSNLMMYYPPEAEPKAILKDLQHLLKISQVG